MIENRYRITAENTAAVRAFEALRPTDRRICHDAFARCFLSDRFTDQINPAGAIFRILRRWEKVVPGVCGAILARTSFGDACLARALDNRFGQLVILGAGFDTRALRFSGLKSKVRIFELDHPATQQFKLDRLKSTCPGLGNHVIYIPIDFEKDDFGRAPISRGYDRAMQTFFIWEGVSYYLTATAVDDTRSFIAGNSASGSEIVFDYFPPCVTGGACELPEARSLAGTLAIFGETLRLGIAPDKIADFMQQRGYQLLQNLSGEDCRHTYFKGKARSDRTVSNLFYFARAKVS